MTPESEVAVDEQGRGELAGLASALTGEPAAAAQLLGEVTALARDQRDPDEDDAGRARALLVERFLRRGRRRSSPPPPRPDPDESEPDHPAPVPDPVRDRLDRLDPVPRAVLVLRHREGLTLGEIARLTGRPIATADRALQEAEQAVDATPWALRQSLAVPAPAADAVRSAARAWTARRRRARGRVLLAALTGVALVVSGSVLPGLLRPDPYVRPRGAWVYGFSLAPSPDFRPAGRSLSPTEDAVTVNRVDRPGRSCSVTLTTGGGVAPPDGRSVRVGDRRGRLVPAEGDGYRSLWWWVAADTTGRVRCDEPTGEEVLRPLAALVRYGPEPLRLPLALPALPVEDEVRVVFEHPEGSGALVVPRAEPEDSPDTMYVSVPSRFDEALAPSSRTAEVTGVTAEVYDELRGQAVCWPAGGDTACVGAYPFIKPTPRERRQVLQHLLATARAVRVAPDVADRGTWFPAADALPG